MSNTPLPAPYILLPRRLAADLRDNALAIGLYLLIGRLYLVAHAPIPLVRTDILRYDPKVKTGAVKRALDRLLDGGWLLASGVSGSPERHYLPAWGVVGDAASPWRLDAPALGRPRHLAALAINRDLLDIGLRRAQPHPQHPVENTRYLAAPALSLAEVGAYALLQAGLGRATPLLIELELTGELPPARTLLRRLASVEGLELSEAGQRRLGLAGEGAIGGRIGGLIGPPIGSAAASEAPRGAPGHPIRAVAAPAATDTAIMSKSSESTSPHRRAWVVAVQRCVGTGLSRRSQCRKQPRRYGWRRSM